MTFTPTQRQKQLVEAVVAKLEENRGWITTFLTQIVAAVSGEPRLEPLIHSTKQRVKSAKSLRTKCFLKMRKCAEEGTEFTITPENLLERVTDLAGFRILHLHSKQIESIHPLLVSAFGQWRFELREAFARTWDDESRALYERVGLKNEPSDRMYTSVHYVLASNSEVRVTGEVQVRTLAEELWGEVDHTINYPMKSPSLDSQEQIKVLARMTSACTRLVDSVFESHARATPPKEANNG
jgi:ppGpp synthetase/RelA/SpoT-type nucleotidyltranferase